MASFSCSEPSKSLFRVKLSRMADDVLHGLVASHLSRCVWRSPLLLQRQFFEHYSHSYFESPSQHTPFTHPVSFPSESLPQPHKYGFSTPSVKMSLHLLWLSSLHLSYCMIIISLNIVSQGGQGRWGFLQLHPWLLAGAWCV